jgi:flagellar hook assembly protein FlgD
VVSGHVIEAQFSVGSSNGGSNDGAKDMNVISSRTGSHAQIGFAVDRPAHVVIKIYSREELVRELVNKDYAAGTYTESWDGKNNSGQKVAAGIYTGVIDIGGQKPLKKKLAVVK